MQTIKAFPPQYIQGLENDEPVSIELPTIGKVASNHSNHFLKAEEATIRYQTAVE